MSKKKTRVLSYHLVFCRAHDVLNQGAAYLYWPYVTRQFLSCVLFVTLCIWLCVNSCHSVAWVCAVLSAFAQACPTMSCIPPLSCALFLFRSSSLHSCCHGHPQ